ncbi:MAG: peptidylprolyl isomerase, partial [Persicimonas sp.]
MNRCKTLLLALFLGVGLVFAIGCDQNNGDDSKDKEEASAEEAEKDKEDDKSSDKSSDSEELPLEATDTVAVVDGHEITADDFNEAIEMQAGAMGGQMPPQAVDMMKKRTVDRLIDEHLIDKRLEKADIEIDSEEVDKEFESFKERFPNEQAFESFLDRSGVSMDEMRDNVRKDLQLRELLSEEYGVEVTDEEAKEYYEDNPERFEEDEQVRARHILIKTEEGEGEEADKKAKDEAEELAKKAKKDDADFAKLAEEHSDDPSKEKGGDLGFFTKDKMVPEFSDKAFDMKKGEISDPVKSQFGYHIIKVEDTKEAGKVEFEDAKEDIFSQLERQKFQETMEEFLEDLKEDVEIEKKEDVIETNVDDSAGGGQPPMGGQQPQGGQPPQGGQQP